MDNLQLSSSDESGKLKRSEVAKRLRDVYVSQETQLAIELDYLKVALITAAQGNEHTALDTKIKEKTMQLRGTQSLVRAAEARIKEYEKEENQKKENPVVAPVKDK